MEKYCVSLALAQKMKDLGFPQDTEFYWQCVRNGEWTFEESWNILNFSHPEVEQYAAPNVGELGEWLPWTITVPGTHYCGDNKVNAFYLEFEKSDDDKWVYFYSNGEENLKYFPNAYHWDSEVDARAKMLIYLVENKLLDVKDLV